jgi:hypothetical protein
MKSKIINKYLNEFNVKDSVRDYNVEDAINKFNRDLDSFLRDHGFASMARVGSVGRAIEVFKKELEIYKRKGQTPLKRGGH